MVGLRTALVVAALCGAVVAQVPSLGWCPDYVPMSDFNMERVRINNIVFHGFTEMIIG